MSQEVSNFQYAFAGFAPDWKYAHATKRMIYRVSTKELIGIVFPSNNEYTMKSQIWKACEISTSVYFTLLSFPPSSSTFERSTLSKCVNNFWLFYW